MFVKTIESRIIDLTSKKILVSREIKDLVVLSSLEPDIVKYRELSSQIISLRKRLESINKLLEHNKKLLGHDDRHEWQLEN